MLGDAASWEVTAPALLPGPVERSKGKALGPEGPGAAPGSRGQGYFLPQKGRWAPQDVPRGVPVAPLLQHTPTCAHLPTFAVVLKSFGCVFPWRRNSGVNCFSYCILLKILVLIIRTATGANAPSPSSLLCIPKTCPSQNSGFSRTGHNPGSQKSLGTGDGDTRGP